MSYFKQPISEEIFKMKYCLNGEQGPDDVFMEVAREIAGVEQTPVLIEKWKREFYSQMESGKFIPAGRILANAKVDSLMKNYNNCFTIDLEDSIEGIFESLKEDAIIGSVGGGVGFNASKLRPKGAPLSKGGESSGVISFLKVFDQSARTIMTGGARRAAHIAILDISHPEIIDFITCKQGDHNGELTQFNISVGITDAFIKAVEADADWDLVFEDKIYNTIKAKWLYELLTKNAFCVSGNTEIPISTESGISFSKIKNLDPSKTYKTFSVNPATLNIEEKKIEAILNNGVKTTIKITLSSGETVSITPDHRLFVAEEGNSFKEKRGELLEIGDWVATSGYPKTFLGVPNDEDFFTMLGFWVGDGSLKDHSVRFAVNDYTQKYISPVLDRIAERYNKEVKIYTDKRSSKYKEYNIHSTDLVKKIRSLGIDKNHKRVPDILFTERNYHNITAFLRGYITADGHVHKKQKNIIFNSKDYELIDGVKKLLLTLNVPISVSKSNKNSFNQMIFTGVIKVKDMTHAFIHDLFPLYTDSTGYKCRKSYTPAQAYTYSDIKNRNKGGIWRRNGEIPTTAVKKPSRLTYSKIVSIEYMGEDVVYDLTVEDNHNFLNTDGIVLHNCHNEPGIFNLDTVEKYNNGYYKFKIKQCNPCGEIVMGPYSLCCLGAINLTKFVHAPFTSSAYFDFDDFFDSIYVGVRFLDNVLDATDYPLEKIEKVSKTWRRIGLGFTGLGNAFTMLGMKYGSKESKLLSERIGMYLRDTSYAASANLAEEKGSFPGMNINKLMEANFITTLPNEIQNKIKGYGLRNIGLNTIAPTGTTSLSLGNNCSSGIEPAFALQYDRNIRTGRGEETKKETIYDYAYLLYKELHGEDAKIPDYFSTTADIGVYDGLEIQAIFQKYIDHSISKTHNLKPGTTFEEYKDLFMIAYKKGLKGFTTFNPEGSMKGILEYSKKEETIPRIAPKRPMDLSCDIHKISVNGVKLLILIGIYNDKPYELFVTAHPEDFEVQKQKHGVIRKSKMSTGNRYSLIINGELIVRSLSEEFAEEYGDLSRLLSMSLRHDSVATPLQFVVGQLVKAKVFSSFSRGVARVLKKYIPEEEKDLTSEKCPECGEALTYIDGCKTCMNCRMYSKCD